MVLKKYDTALYLMMISSGDESSRMIKFVKNVPGDVLQLFNGIIDKNEQLVPYEGNYIGNDSRSYEYNVSLIPRSYFNDLGIYLNIKRDNGDTMELTLQPVKVDDINNTNVMKNIGSLKLYKFDRDKNFLEYYSSFNYIDVCLRGIDIGRSYSYNKDSNYNHMEENRLNVNLIPDELYMEDISEEYKGIKGRR